jgi:hypothetical protein
MSTLKKHNISINTAKTGLLQTKMTNGVIHGVPIGVDGCVCGSEQMINQLLSLLLSPCPCLYYLMVFVRIKTQWQVYCKH